MDTQKIDASKITGMVMCGDHPSFTKTALNVKEPLSSDKELEKLIDKEDNKFPLHYGRISPSQSRAAAGVLGANEGRSAAERARVASEHGLLADPPRPRPALPLARPQAHLLQAAALGSFRWPPYLLCVWVLVLILGHVLHCLVAVLERALPHVRKSCQYFRKWTEESWRGDTSVNQRARPVALACVTAAAYALYCGLYVVYALALWAVEPLADLDDKTTFDEVSKVTDYIDDTNSRINTSVKQ